MAKTAVKMAALGGGGKSGTETVTSTSQEITINTGLSSISKFMLHGTNSGYTVQTGIFYTSDDASNFIGIGTQNSQSGVCWQSTFQSSAAGKAVVIKSISGGTVKVITPSSLSLNTLYWMAE